MSHIITGTDHDLPVNDVIGDFADDKDS